VHDTGKIATAIMADAVDKYKQSACNISRHSSSSLADSTACMLVAVVIAVELPAPSKRLCLQLVLQ
jgi:hypothetical protein